MLKIKLVRSGRKKSPSYRIVIAPLRSKITGKIVTSLGYYNPQDTPPKLSVDRATLNKWLRVGTQPTESVRKLLKL